METKKYSIEVDAINKKIADLDGILKQQVENNIALEQYTRTYASITSRRRNTRNAKR